MNLKVMPLIVQRKQNFIGMNSSNPQIKAGFSPRAHLSCSFRGKSDEFTYQVDKDLEKRRSFFQSAINGSSISISGSPHHFEPDYEEKSRDKEQKLLDLEYSDPVQWAKNWNYNARRQHYDKLYENEIRYKFTRIGNKKIKAKYDERFNREQSKVNHILNTLHIVQDKLNQAQRKEEAAKAQAKVNMQLKSELEFTELLKERIDARLNDPNANINKAIAGYDEAKERLRDGFLAPIELEKEYIKKYNEMMKKPQKYTQEELKDAKSQAYGVSVPPSILFYGCFGTGKNTFARAAAAESGCKYEVFSPANEEFSAFITRVLNESKQRYLTEGKRTVAVVNEAEKYLNNSYLNIELKDNEEGKRLREVKDNVSRMRDTLDNCSQLPRDDGEKGASAVSFFFTTNHPKDMLNIGILLRRGRMPIVMPIEPADEDNLKEVLKFHIKRVMPKRGNFNLQKYDLSKIVDKLKLSDEKGCYSNDRIRDAMDEIRRDYDKKSKTDFKAHLEESIFNNKCSALKRRDITPEIYEQYYDDYEKIGEG